MLNLSLSLHEFMATHRTGDAMRDAELRRVWRRARPQGAKVRRPTSARTNVRDSWRYYRTKRTIRGSMAAALAVARDETAQRVARMALIVACMLLPAFRVDAYDDRDYCRAQQQLAAQRCHLEHQAAMIDCADDYAFARWADLPDALGDVMTCRRDAAEACAECKRDVEVCE